MSSVISYLFVKNIFNKEIIDPAEEMVDRIHKEFRFLLSTSYWMDGQTRTAGLEKVDSMLHIIGYDKRTQNATLLDEEYQNMPELEPNDHIGNCMKLARVITNRTLHRLVDKPDRSRFVMAPFTANAAYSLSHNAMVIPGGILQPPFFRPNSLAAVNYGALGSVIGHEITHGFDNTGRRLDKCGNLRHWWSERSKQRFLQQAVCFVKQYEKYPMQEDLDPEEAKVLTPKDKINGITTISENIADNGGLRAAYRAFKNRILYYKKEEKNIRLPGLENYSPQQIFFISFAQTWCAAYTPEGLKIAVTGKQHSPGPFRIKGVFENNLDMREAFGCRRNFYSLLSSECKLW